MTNPILPKHKAFQLRAEKSGVELDINVRWETGIPHHQKSKELYAMIENCDWLYCDDFFCWKSGGDGDNGETLMYELDIIFEMLDKENQYDHNH